MYRYQPPKGNIWGHRLRNMPAVLAKQRFAAFLAAAVADHRFVNAHLVIPSPDLSLVARFERRIGTSAHNNTFELNDAQCDACIDEVIQLEATTPGSAKTVVLAQFIEVSAWRIGGSSVPTCSRFTMYYGALACLSTSLQFDHIDQFREIASALADAKICKLNENRLKWVK
jgi:hypothetical protein